MGDGIERLCKVDKWHCEWAVLFAVVNQGPQNLHVLHTPGGRTEPPLSRVDRACFRQSFLVKSLNSIDPMVIGLQLPISIIAPGSDAFRISTV